MTTFYVGEFYRIDDGMSEDGKRKDVLLFHSISAIYRPVPEYIDWLDEKLRREDKEFARDDDENIEIGLMLNIERKQLAKMLEEVACSS